MGSRYIPGGRIENWPWSRLALSWGANQVARLLVGREVHDWTSGFKCYRREMLAALRFDRITSEGYSFQVEILFHCLRDGWKLREVPITFVDRLRGRTKMSRREIYQAAPPCSGSRGSGSPRDGDGGRPLAHLAGGRHARPDRGERGAPPRGRSVGGSLLRRILLLLVRAPSEPWLFRPPAALDPDGVVEHGAHGRRRPPHPALAVHRAVRGDDVAPLRARPASFRGMAGLSCGTAHEPRARVRAERRDLPPARRAPDVLLARLRMVPRARPPSVEGEPPSSDAAPIAWWAAAGSCWASGC